MPDRPDDEKQALERERLQLLRKLDAWLEVPMFVLGLAWLVLLVLELTRGLTPFLEHVGTAIWIIFILDFALKLTLAPKKVDYIRGNWLTVLALAVPALRVFRIFRFAAVLRAARATRGLRLVRVVASINRGMKALGGTMGRRGFGYVAALTALVTVGGAAGMYAFESDAPGGRGFDDFGSALWWTAMIMTTMGSDYWPRNPEGRLLCLFLSLYAFAVFGYVTATLASFFIERDAGSGTELAGARSMDALRDEIAALRQEVRDLRPPPPPGGPPRG